MKKHLLIFFSVITAVIVLAIACNNPTTEKKNLQGQWKSKDGSTKLTINKKQFIMDMDSPIPEDYFVKGDTIFTSFEGNQPYTKFIIQKLDEHNMNLLYPDSVSVEFIR
jgi:biopolymer transport protein ExbD